MAQDLTAETFCRAMAAFDRYEDRGLPVRAWLFRIAYNLVVAESRKRAPRIVQIDDDSGAVAVEDQSDRSDRLTEAREAREALAKLPETQRTVLELRFLQDLSVSETASVLGSNEQAVRAMTYRALRSLRAALAANEGSIAKAAV
jgi:RNA polymerase sigma-70 factor (ECF subfamily)